MSNFQRTRSKVWWGDSPPNIASPLPTQPLRSMSNMRDHDWEPQLPHWIANQPNNQQLNVAVGQQNNLNQWPLRHGSPGSHKSQDSGFSDSDSSPPASQYYPSPESNDSRNKSSSSSDSNNNENVTVRQILDVKNTPQDKNVSNSLSNKHRTPIPTPRLLNASHTQTPIQSQNNKENCESIQKIQVSAKNNNRDKNPPSLNNNEKFVTRISIDRNLIDKNMKNIVNDYENNIVLEKYNVNKTFTIGGDDKHERQMIAVQEIDKHQNKTDKNFEFIVLSDNKNIYVNNQPRVRTPITNIPTNNSSRNPDYRRSLSNEENMAISTTPTFKRSRLNKSLNLEGQKLDQQILNIQEGYHSLSFIDEEVVHKNDTTTNHSNIQKSKKTLLGKNILDSLQLKPTKRNGLKSRQRISNTSKVEKTVSPCTKNMTLNNTRVNKDSLSINSKDNRVPTLGLPQLLEDDSWVIIDHPLTENTIPSNEDFTKPTNDDQNDYRNRKITPPPEFQDNSKIPYQTETKKSNDLAYDSKREKLKDTKTNFDFQLNLACTSTPKMLAPYELLNTSINKVTKKSKKDLSEDFNAISGVILNNRDEIMYRERNIDLTTLERLCERKPEPLQYWLCDLIGSCETECMTTLQSKPLGVEQKAIITAGSTTITGNIKKVQTHGQIIIYQYSEVLRQLESNEANEEEICLLIANINEFVLAHSITLNTKPPGETPERWDKIRQSLQVYLQKLIDIGEDVKIELNESNVEWAVVGKHLEHLVEIFLETTKAVLVQQMKTLVSIIEEPPSDLVLKSTLTSIGHLAMLSENAPSSLHAKCEKIVKNITELPFVECAVPRALLTAIIETNKSSVKALSLRALATVCVTGVAVKQFEEGGGIEILADILSEEKSPEPQWREAVTVLTQVTAPWLRGHTDLKEVRRHLDTIVVHITRILSRTECCQLLLLCTACLVNLVRELELGKQEERLRESEDIIQVLARCRTVDKLLEAVKRRGPNLSVFLQEQTSFLLACLCRSARGLRVVLCARAAPVALCCWAHPPPPPSAPPRPAELRAHTRLLCHATEALSCLSVMPDTAHQIVELEGVSHLTKLVRAQKGRHTSEPNPDQTLMFCLKALRILYKHCPAAFKPDDVEEMIKPHLMKSLMLFSAKQESYV